MNILQELTNKIIYMGNFSSREIEFNNTVSDYYDSLTAGIIGEDAQEYVFTSEGGVLLDRVARNDIARWHELGPMEVSAFIHALARVIGYFKHLAQDSPIVFGNDLVSRRLEELGIIPPHLGSPIYDHFRGSIVLPSHKKIIANILENQELVFWLKLYYEKYSKSVYGGGVTGSERIEIKVALGIIMVHLMSLGIRPYMLESDSHKKREMIINGHDWVYKLSELFDDFQRTQDYFGYQNLVADISEHARMLQEMKFQKKSKELARGILNKFTQSPPSASSHPQDPRSP